MTMFRYNYANDDPFNTKGERNVKNADTFYYNCGGYALGTFSWYCPHTEQERFYDYAFKNEIQACVKTTKAVAQMCNEFEGRIRVIESLKELNSKTEYAVAFRISSRNDFHFIKRSKYGRWTHKRGACDCIERITKKEVFETEWSNGFYDGPIILLAVKNN